MGFFVLFQCLKLCNRNLGFSVFRDLFSFFKTCNEILCSQILMFLFSVNCMRECDRFLSNGSLVCPKSVNGFLTCLHEFSKANIGKLGGNISYFFHNKIFSGKQNDTRIFLILLHISCPKTADCLLPYFILFLWGNTVCA